MPRLALALLLTALLLPACSAAADLQVLLTPLPTFPASSGPADLDATVQAIVQLTAAAPTGSPTPTSTASPLPPTPLPTRTPSPTPSPTATRTALPYVLPVNVGPFVFPENINPLTGLFVSDPALLERRPMAIKITNFPRHVRPQSGLSLADLVYEYYIEMGLTRFIAVFYGNDVERIGPIRSGRFFDEHVVRMYDAIFAFASADKRVLEPWLESDLVLRLVLPRTDNCPPLCRDQHNADYNNLYTNTAHLGPYVQANGSDNNRYDQGGMRFQTLTPWGGTPLEQLYIRYSRLDYHYWQYNAQTGRYERFQETAEDNGGGEQYAPLIDEYTGQQISAANVVVLMVPHEEFVKSSDTEVIKINLEGSGQAYIFRDGQVYEAIWVRAAQDAPIQLFRAGPGEGSYFPLKPGNTFFQVIGMTSEVLQGDEVWRINFAIP